MPSGWKWSFNGYESLVDGTPVQRWFDHLPENDRGEIIDLLLSIQNATAKQWRRPEFDPLLGAGGISEIIVPPIRSFNGETYYRIYGYFGPGDHEYTFLHGTDKVVKNDTEGKRIAKERLDKINREEAGVCKFNL